MRLKEILQERNITNVALADMLHITKQAAGKIVNATSINTATAERIAHALNVPVWQLFASPDEVAAHQADNNELCAFLRYRASNKTIHLYADKWEQFWEIVDELSSTHPRPRKQP